MANPATKEQGNLRERRVSAANIQFQKGYIYEWSFLLRSLNFDVFDSVYFLHIYFPRSICQDKLEFSCPIALAQHLREYPIPFGRKFVDLYGELTTTAKGFSKPPESLPPAMESFERMPLEDPGFGLQFAALEEVYTYLRRCKYLHIPSHWKHLVPKEAF